MRECVRARPRERERERERKREDRESEREDLGLRVYGLGLGFRVYVGADPRRKPVRTEMLSMYVFSDFTCIHVHVSET